MGSQLSKAQAAIREKDEIRLRKVLAGHAAGTAKLAKRVPLIHYACNQDSSANICQILHDFSFDLFTTNKLGATPLHVACYSGNLSIAQWTLNKDIDPNALTIGGETALYWTVAGGGEYTKHLIRLLGNRGAKPNIADALGDTPLHVACRLARPEVVVALLEIGADPMVKNNAQKFAHQCVDKSSAGVDCKTIIRIHLYKRAKNDLLRDKATAAFEEVKKIIINARKTEKKTFGKVLKILPGTPEDIREADPNVTMLFSGRNKSATPVDNPLLSGGAKEQKGEKEEKGDEDADEEERSAKAPPLESGKHTLIPFAVPPAESGKKGLKGLDEINVVLPGNTHFAVVKLPKGVRENTFVYITVSIDGDGHPIAMPNKDRTPSQEILEDLAAVSTLPATKALTEEWVNANLSVEEETGCRICEI